MGIKLVSAVLFVLDIAVSRKFYEETLGQQVQMDHGPNVGFSGGFAIWQKEHANQMVFGASSPEKASEAKNAAELYFETEELEDAIKKLNEAQVLFIHPLTEQPWGQRVIRFRDPDGHILELGEPMDSVIRRFLSQGLTPADIVKRTFMPLEIINLIASASK